MQRDRDVFTAPTDTELIVDGYEHQLSFQTSPASLSQMFKISIVVPVAPAKLLSYQVSVLTKNKPLALMNSIESPFVSSCKQLSLSIVVSRIDA